MSQAVATTTPEAGRPLLTPNLRSQLGADIDTAIRTLHVRLSDVYGCMEPGDIYMEDEPPHTIRCRRSEAVIESLRKLHFALLDTRDTLAAEVD